MENNPFFSVVLPAYNRSFIIREAIESVLNQKFEDWELIVINDGSSDETECEILQFLGDKRIVYLKNKRNLGAAISRNIGIRQSKGKYISFLDSDNRFNEGFLQTFYETIKSSKNIDIFWSGVIREIIKDRNIERIEKHSWTPDVNDKNFFLKQIRTSTGRGLVVRRTACINVGLFDEKIPAAEDTEFLIRLFQNYKGKWIEGYWYTAVIHEGDRLSTNFEKQAEAYSIIINKHYDYFKKNISHSGRFFRKGAYYYYLSKNKRAAYKLLLEGFLLAPFDLKYIYYVFRFMF